MSTKCHICMNTFYQNYLAHRRGREKDQEISKQLPLKSENLKITQSFLLKTFSFRSIKTESEDTIYITHEYETETADVVEYLLETDNNETIDESSYADEELFIKTDDCNNEDKEIQEEGERTTICYVEDNEEQSKPQQADESDKRLIPPTQQAPPPCPSEIDVWLQTVKLAMSNLTKINQARVKRDVNAILSKYEIEQLQSDET